MADILLHACCAHCLGKLLAGIDEIASGEWRPVAFWFNPNIHPLIEYRRRLKAVKMLCERANLELLADETYGLVPFVQAVHGKENPPARCGICYQLRLEEAAKTAAAHGIPRFTSTLVTSTHQDHTLIAAAGDAAAAKHGVSFHYRDLRAAEAAPKLMHMLYRQQYCGCIFSEAERFAPTRTHLYPPKD